MPSIQNFSQSQSGYYIVRGVLLICLLIFILVGLTYWGEANNFDLRFSAEFFNEEKEWFLAETPPWNWLYEYGVVPGILVSILSFFTWIYLRTNKKLAILAHISNCALTPIIASALLVNVVLKDHTVDRVLVRLNNSVETGNIYLHLKLEFPDVAILFHADTVPLPSY
ncbi:MAG: hypothetical protein CM1200mP28_01260 [Deltaproteobacteria bacterium]|nr:MAG: hypothetical protein CM1200mP28_01260 [Deltaproteobacteria bacterium]